VAEASESGAVVAFDEVVDVAVTFLVICETSMMASAISRQLFLETLERAKVASLERRRVTAEFVGQHSAEGIEVGIDAE